MARTSRVRGYFLHDTVRGVFFPRGGLRAVPDALAAAAETAGATIRYRTEVAALERFSGRVRAVHTTHGQRIPCDAIVLTPDLPASYELLGYTPRRPVGLRYSPSAFVLHATAGSLPANLAHHTISFGGAWKQTFREIIDAGRCMTDPSLLITAPTRSDPELADGKELVSVLAPCPNLGSSAMDWDRIEQPYTEEIQQILNDRFAGLGDSLSIQRRITPAHWARDGLANGTPFSVAHTFSQTGPFRPRNLVRGTENAVLAGCGTTPGVGVPTAVISGALAAKRITGAA